MKHFRSRLFLAARLIAELFLVGFVFYCSGFMFTSKVANEEFTHSDAEVEEIRRLRSVDINLESGLRLQREVDTASY